jgi:peptide/nickel transport system permease protein
LVGFFIILVYAGCALGAQWIAHYHPEEIDFAAMLSPPGEAHWFGTDQYGRDVFSRIVYGSRTALAVGIMSSLFGCTLGAVLGATSGYFGGRIDTIIQRFVDIMLSFPIIVLAMVVVAVLGKQNVFGVDVNLIAAIALPIIPKMARVARSSTLSIVAMPFIDAARAAGFSHTRIILRHILPNIVAPYLIMVTAFVAQAILLEASLSFLGLGVTEPTPAWGLMLSGASADFYQTAPWMILFPGIAITLAVFAFNLFGDSLRDWLDPKLKS